jgi:peroxiredoxin
MSFQEIFTAIATSDLPLQAKLDAFKKEFETKLAPASVVELLHRATDELIEAGAADNALRAGDIAPVFTLFDADGNLVSSQDLLAKGPLVVSFYRGIWCPYCNLDLAALEETRGEIEARGASLVAISQQTPISSRKSQRQNGLAFPILSDKGGIVAEEFGIRWTLPEYLREVHRALGADLVQFNGEDSWTLPMPARYVIGQDGVIAYAEVNADYTQRPDPANIFPVLDQLRRRRVA